MNFDFPELLRSTPAIDCLEVQSFEMGVYLVHLQLGEQSGMLFENGQLKRFHNAQHIRESFETFEVKQAVMKHDSPYDEMIGNPPKAEKPMLLPFSITQPY